MTDRADPAPPTIVAEIRIAAWLDYAPAAKWFPGMSLRYESDGATVLRGPLPDQAALFGILHRLRDLAVPLRSVDILPAGGAEPHGAGAAARPDASGETTMKSTSTPSDPHPAGESVLITGCSSGIGLATAIHLAARGFHVLAAVRKETDAERLRSFRLAGLEPLCPLDLSDPDQIASAAAAVRESLARKGRDRLYAIVNNAGGGFIAPVELLDLARFRTELEARLVGPVALLQHLLPLVRRARGGRILWIATPGLIAVPYVSSIHAGEFAMTCIAQSLHLELSPWGIANILIACGGIRTAAPARTRAELERDLRVWPREKSDLYVQSLEKLQKQFERFDRRRTEPERVARTVYAALQAEKPKRKYLADSQAGMMNLLGILPQSIVDAVFMKRI
ncbi:MAG: SDR family NAD(P)-dependent oxidoreductase [Anaerolineales bacterium]|nr:SDR family NAD(P)-dependent oxidoreductase [Anaerolineales bacterium]